MRHMASSTTSNSPGDARRRRLLRGFERAGRRLRPSLVRRHGQPFADDVLAAARLEFERLLPQLPDVGRWNVFGWVMVVNGWLVAFFRAMRSRGRTAEETVRACAETSDELLRSIPPWLLRLFGRIAFSRPARAILRRAAARSQARRYPADFVFTFHEGGSDDWELRFSECAVNKFYDVQAVPELKPYCNFFDVTYSRLMDMGVDAHETIGRGCTTCRLRYKRGRPTTVPVPLRDVLPGARP
jgi:hypothetical protein